MNSVFFLLFNLNLPEHKSKKSGKYRIAELNTRLDELANISAYDCTNETACLALDKKKQQKQKQHFELKIELIYIFSLTVFYLGLSRT